MTRLNICLYIMPTIVIFSSESKARPTRQCRNTIALLEPIMTLRRRPLARVALFLLLLLTACSSSDSNKPSSPKQPAVQAEGTPLELEPSREPFPLGLSVSEGFALHLFDTPSSNQGFKVMPPESGAKRHFDEFTLAGKAHLVITEESNPPKFHFDENRNGNLTDDRPPALGEKPGLVPNTYSIHIRYDDEKVVAPYRFWLFGSNMGGVRFYPVCHWHGTLMVKDKPFKVVAFDGNADGDYSNDPVVMDLDGNGKADEGEKLIPGSSVTIEGEQVTLVSISSSGLTARFKMK